MGRAGRVSIGAALAAATFLAGCTGPVVRDTGPRRLPGRGPGTEAAVPPQPPEPAVLGGLRVLARREPWLELESLTLAVPAGGRHGPAAVALAEVLAERLRERAVGLHGVATVEIHDTTTTFRLDLAPERVEQGIEALLAVLGDRVAVPEEALAAAAATIDPAVPGSRSLSMEELREGLYRSAPSEGRTALAGVGPVTPDRFLAAARGASSGEAAVPVPSLPPAPRRRHIRSMADGRVVLGLPAPSPIEPEGVATGVLAELLSGRFGRRLAERAGARSLQASHIATPAGGLLVVDAAVGGEAQETAYQIVRELLALGAGDIPEADWRDGVARARLGLGTRLSSPGGRSEILARQMATSSEAGLGGFREAWEEIDAAAVADAARRDRGAEWWATFVGGREPSFELLEGLAARWSGGPRETPAAPAWSAPRAPAAPVRWRVAGGKIAVVLERDPEAVLSALALRRAGGVMVEPRERAGATRLLVRCVVLRLERDHPRIRVSGVVEREAYGIDLEGAWEDLQPAASAAAALLWGTEPLDASSVPIAKAAISRASRQRRSHPLLRAVDLAREAAFGQAPYGRPQGLAGSIDALGPEDLARWRASAPRGPVIAYVVGDLEESRLRGDSAAWSPPLDGPATPADAPRYRGGRVERAQGRRPSATVCVAWPSVGRSDPGARYVAVQVLQRLLSTVPEPPSPEHPRPRWVLDDAGERAGLFLLCDEGVDVRPEARGAAYEELLRARADRGFSASQVRAGAEFVRVALEATGATTVQRAGRGADAELRGCRSCPSLRQRLEEVGPEGVEAAMRRILEGPPPVIGVVDALPGS